MYIKPEKLGHAKPEKQPKAKYRKVSTKKAIEKMDKKANVKQLVNDLDNVFSEYIRKRNADEKGFAFCFTCGKFDHYSKLQCGHYWSRKYYGTRWDEVNCQPQCVRCNIFSQGAGPAFASNLVKTYGTEILSLLEIAKNRTFKLEVFVLSLLIREYSARIEKLAHTHG